MVQARVLRKHNFDSHYTNAIYSFMKERAVKYREDTVMVSADATCKVSVGEPGYPIAAVSRGKQVIVGTFKVGDHDYSKISLIPSMPLIHSIPENFDTTVETNNPRVGDWYTGQVYYSVKDMICPWKVAQPFEVWQNWTKR